MGTLARRIAAAGPLPAGEAVRLAVRIARSVEGLHERGKTHGRLSPDAIRIVGDDLSSATLLPTATAPSRAAFHSPQRSADGPASRDDDAYAVALILFFLLTGSGSEARAAGGKLPSLAVFDAGDDELDGMLQTALAPDAMRDVRILRRELDLWLQNERASIQHGLPFQETGDGARSAIDLSSLPPPPEAETQTPALVRGPPPVKALFTVMDEDSTLPRDDAEAPPPPREERVPASAPATPRSVHPPRLVPPKLARKKRREDAAPKTPAFEHTALPIAESRAPEPSATEGGRWKWWAVFVAAVIAGVVIALLRSSGDDRPGPAAPSGPVASASGGRAPATTPSAAGASEQPSASASEQPSVSASSEPSASASEQPSSEPSSSAAASAAASGAPATSDARACIQGAFPAGTFPSTPRDLDFVCSELDAVKGAARLRTAIVVSGKREVTEGMKEWALLGFYEMAAYAAIHDCCCPGAPQATTPESPEVCNPSASRAVRAVSAAVGGDEKQMTAAIAGLDKVIRCITRAKRGDVFGGHPRATGGEGTALRKLLARLPAEPR